MASASSSADTQPGFTYAPGDVIAGKYALEDQLGVGGMGAVFRARNTAIDMPVAIKVIRADLNRDALSSRLLQEARAAAKLSHPAIVRVFDIGQTALGDPFIVMELLHGESLAAVIDREGRLTSVRAVQVLLPIADALSAAHAKGFIHRDVKPDNVFLVYDEGTIQPKLVDFGIVKLGQRDPNSQLTQVGAVLGSPEYMSPEQARGQDDIDQRSDVWSFSVMLFEAIADTTPFTAKNYNALLRQIVEEEPCTLLDVAGADAELSAIVMRGLSKDPAARFPSMGNMGKALAEWLVRQGMTEDICGVSLDTRWIQRVSDSAPPASRPSRISSPGSWPEPPSGVRAVRGSFVSAPTLAAPSEAGTPAPLAATQPPPHQRPMLLGIAGGALAAALVLLWLALRPSPPEPAVAVPAAPPVTAPEPPRAVEPAAAPTPAAMVAAPVAEAESSPSAAAVPRAPKPSKPVARAKAPAKIAAPPSDTKTTPPEKPAAKPASDLLAPY